CSRCESIDYDASDPCDEQERNDYFVPRKSRRRRGSPRQRDSCCRFWFCQKFKFLRHFRVAELLCVEIYGVNADAVFHFALTKIVQKRTPPRILLQIFSDMLGKENVSGIAAIH